MHRCQRAGVKVKQVFHERESQRRHTGINEIVHPLIHLAGKRHQQEQGNDFHRFLHATNNEHAKEQVVEHAAIQFKVESKPDQVVEEMTCKGQHHAPGQHKDQVAQSFGLKYVQ